MRLLNFTAKNVHQYLEFDIKFNEDVTFLIGINGTGKTSVLKIILGLISPSYSYLNQIDFEYAKLECWSNDNISKATIEARKIEPDLIEIKLKKDFELHDYIGFLKKNRNTNQNLDYSIDEDNDKFASAKREFDAQVVIQEIKKLSTPIFLGLDRRIYEGQKIDRLRQSMHRRKFRKYQFSDALNLSLIDFQVVLYDFYRQMAFRQPEINERFRNQIVSGSFEFIEDSKLSSFKDLFDLNVKRENVIKAVEKLNMDFFVTQIHTFFDKMEEIELKVREAQKGVKAGKGKGKAETPLDVSIDIDILQKWFNNQPQLKRINEIIEISQQYQQQIDELYEPIERLKKIVNYFFNENNKSLEIDSNGDLSVRLKSGTPTTVFELSSGEKQIITIIGHLIFFESQFKKEPGVFIIDEPELSLHLAWQQLFVSSLLEASPKMQLILATHSPSIVEKYGEQYCEDLAKLN